MIKENFVLISSATLFKESRGKIYWLIIKQTDESDWELPKATVRRGESSVRAILRVLGELAGMSVKVLEESGRASASTVIGGKAISEKFLYYLIIFKASAGEILGFNNYEWLDFAKAVKKLASRRDKEMLRKARIVLKTWKKLHQKKD